jgi:hypothetical protein
MARREGIPPERKGGEARETQNEAPWGVVVDAERRTIGVEFTGRIQRRKRK